MSQNLFPDLWMNPGGGQHHPQTSNYHSTSGVSAGGTIGVDTVGSVGGAQSDLDLNGFSQLGDLSGPGMYSYAANTFTGFPSHGGFFGNSYNSSLFTSSPWSQPPASTSSSYSTLNGAVSNPLSAPQQPQAQPAPSSTAIDPSLTMASGSSALHTNAYASSHSPHQAQYSPSQFTPYSHVSPSALSISTSFQQQQPQISQSQSPPSPVQPSPPMQHVRSPQQSTAPYAMHAPTPVPPSQFYGTASVPSVPTPPSASSSTQPTTSQLPPPPPTEYSPSNVQRENLRATVAPYLTEKSFTGARAVQTLVSAVAEFGITHVDVPLRLEILNKTLQNAGNNYYRAWMENISAMDITREWLKATVSSSAEGQVLETTMPLLTLLDRLPFTGPALKAAKVGKLVRRLSDSAMNAAVKDMASNLERKWKEKFIGGQQRDEPMEVDKSLKGQKRKSDREQDSTTSKSAPPAKKAALNGSSKSSSRATTVQKESSATTRAVGSAGTAGASGVKESKADASFFSKPKSKLPTFKKAPAIQAKKDDASSVSQPSAFNPFQEALKDMERNRRQSPTAQLPPASAAPASPVVSASLSKSGKPKKRVTWAPEGQLELVKLIERVVYSDDSVGSHPVHSNLRELDKGEGAALHLAADTFEELIDWVEPSPLDIPQEIVTPPRGEASEEKVNQERREETALAAMYLTLSQVPESPAEPANVLPLEQTDAQMRTMIPGGEIDAYVVTMRDQQQVVPPTSMQPLQPTVSDLVGQLGIPQQQPQPQPLVEALSHAGVDPNVLSDPNIISQIPQPQLHQLLQLLGSQTAVQPAAEPDTWGQQTPPTNGHLSTPSMPSHESPPPPYSNGEQSNRWDGGPPPRGSGWRGRGRGRGRGGKWRTPCSFFMQGRCKYGDQCDYSHEMSYG